MATELVENEQAAYIRDLKHKIVDLHKELRHIKRIPFRENKYSAGIREIKLADTKLEEAISWLNNALYELMNNNHQQQTEAE